MSLDLSPTDRCLFWQLTTGIQDNCCYCWQMSVSYCRNSCHMSKITAVIWMPAVCHLSKMKSIAFLHLPSQLAYQILGNVGNAKRSKVIVPNSLTQKLFRLNVSFMTYWAKLFVWNFLMNTGLWEVKCQNLVHAKCTKTKTTKAGRDAKTC